MAGGEMAVAALPNYITIISLSKNSFVRRSLYFVLFSTLFLYHSCPVTRQYLLPKILLF